MYLQTLSKAQQTQELRAFTKITAFKSCHKLVKIQLQNLNQTPASKSRPFHLGYHYWLKFSLFMFVAIQIWREVLLKVSKSTVRRFGAKTLH